jgi:RNA polymerase sigma factor (sigma-70 family)
MRRRLTTLFVDIAGSTRLVVRHPPETMLGVVQCFAALVTDIALRHRGRVKDFEQDIARREMSECVRDYVDQLPTDYRTVVVLSELEELPDREIAEVLGISLEAAKIRLHRARARLRRMLDQGCDVSRDESNELTCEPRPGDVSSTD